MTCISRSNEFVFPVKSSDFACFLLFFALKNILVFIGKAQFSWATLSCDSSYMLLLSLTHRHIIETKS